MGPTSSHEANSRITTRILEPEWLRITGSILTPESSKNQGAFLARNSVAVAPAFAHCTNRCTRRKVTVTAQSTKQENRKMKKRSQDENTILKNTIPARGSSIHPEQMGGKEKKGRAEWLRITGSILTPESSKNQGAFLARNSVAVAPAFAHCTNRCTRRKVTVTAQSTKQENRKMKKRSQDENTILKNTIPARGSSTTLAILLVESR